MTTTIAKRQNGNPSVSFGNVVDNIFQNSLRHFFDNNFWDETGKGGHLHAPVNIREMDQHYEIDVIAPGCRKEDFKINLQDNMLIISYQNERRQENKEGESWVRNEFNLQSFTRSFNLDDSIDHGKIVANYADGILRLRLPKSEKASQASREVEIK